MYLRSAQFRLSMNIKQDVYKQLTQLRDYDILHNDMKCFTFNQ